MTNVISDALVFFGATGDLAHKKIFPALQQLAKHEELNMPVIGVAKSGWTLEQLKQRARDSVEHNGGLDPEAFAKLCKVLKYIDGDYSDPATFRELRQQLGSGRASAALSRHPPESFRRGGAATQIVGMLGGRSGCGGKALRT